MKLCTQILAVVESQPSLKPTPVGVEGRNAEEVDYHLMLLNEAGLVEAEQVAHPKGGPAVWHARRLTWAGYDFLERERAAERRNSAGARC